MAKIIFLLYITTTWVWARPLEDQLSYKGATFSFYSNADLKKGSEKAERAIIVIHGSERNASTYYDSIEAMAKKLGKSEGTVIVAPHFKQPEDTLSENELSYSEEGWLRGDESLKAPLISSFEILDHVVRLLGNRTVFPLLKSVVITGHSAGGQMTQRFAAASDVEDELQHLNFKYVVANPGSYLYLTAKRPFDTFVSCPSFNDYKYGLQRRNAYLSRLSILEITMQYLVREIVYFLGEKDVNADDIDQSCPARVQGNTRFERGKYFKLMLDQEYSFNHHELVTVPGVGHTQHGMYLSEQGMMVLFGRHGGSKID